MTWVRQAPGWYTSERGDQVKRGPCGCWYISYRRGAPWFREFMDWYRTLAEAKRAAEE